MLDGLYDFNVQSPMGNLSPVVCIKTTPYNVTGYIELLGKKHEFKDGKYNKNQIFLSGTYSSNFLKIQYTITGYLQNNTLFLTAKTNMGTFNLQGTKRYEKNC